MVLAKKMLRINLEWSSISFGMGRGGHAGVGRGYWGVGRGGHGGRGDKNSLSFFVFWKPARWATTYSNVSNMVP